MGQGRAPFLPMPFLGVAATMSVRGILVGGIVGCDILRKPLLQLFGVRPDERFSDEWYAGETVWKSMSDA